MRHVSRPGPDDRSPGQVIGDFLADLHEGIGDPSIPSTPAIRLVATRRTDSGAYRKTFVSVPRSPSKLAAKS